MTAAVSFPSLEGAAISAGTRTESYSAMIARGVVAIARNGQNHNPRRLAKALGIILRNPNKWLEQPDGTFRVASWKVLRKQSGISDVGMTDVPDRKNKEITSTTGIVFDGSRCASVRSIERAAGIKAIYGGTAYPVMWDAPPPPPVQLGREHAMMDVGDTTITMLTDQPGPKGCLVNLSFERTRAAIAQR